jgi:hypothetical protein
MVFWSFGTILLQVDTDFSEEYGSFLYRFNVKKWECRQVV